MRYLIALLTCISLTSCLKKKFLVGSNELNEDFEGISAVEELYDDPSATWRFYQQTKDANSLEIDTLNPFDGNQCIKFFAESSSKGASKSNLANNDMLFQDGETVAFSAWFFIVGEDDLEDLFLFDIEESVAIGAGPGLRFELESEEGFLKVERGKMLESNIDQPEETKIAFPRDQWVHLAIEIKLSQRAKGYILVYQDDELLINARDIRTLPKDKSTIIQGTKGIYNSVQVGITACSPKNPATVFVDNIEIRTL